MAKRNQPGARRSCHFVYVLVVVASGLVAVAASAETYYVSRPSGSDSGNGLTPGTAFARCNMPPISP